MTRSVFVTGGNRGIGLAVARAFAQAGDAVAVGHRSGEPPEGLFGVPCDVTSPEQVQDAFTKIEAHQGPVEVVVANAGITRDAPALRLDDEDFTDVLDANLVGAFRVARAGARAMLPQRKGRIVFLSSVLAYAGSPGQTNYAASKAGLLGLARSLAWELGPRGITVNVVSPGVIETDMTGKVPAKRMEQLLANTAAGRPGRPEEVAAAIRFLASDDAAFITGAHLPVAGGLGMGA